MKYVTVRAQFDDMDTAEAAARNITHRFPGVKSIKLHYKKEPFINPDRYSGLSLTASNTIGNYTNVGYGVVPPQGAQPMFAVYRAVKAPAYDYVDRKVNISIVAPSDKVMPLTGCLINSGGHFIKS